MTRRAFLGIDQGTRSTKALLLNSQGESLFEESCSVSLNDRGSGMIEQNPVELLESIERLFTRAVEFAAHERISIAAFGLACQRSGVCAWDAASGAVRHPLITWADTRTEPRLCALGSGVDEVRARSTLPLSAHYAGPKIALLQEEFPANEVLIGTLDSYLLNRLLDASPFLTEDTMASRTMLYHTLEGGWDETLCAVFGVDRARLAPIRTSLGAVGNRGGIPLTAFLGDQQSGLVGRCSYGTDAVLTLGSIASLCVPLGEAADTLDGYVTSVYLSAERGGQRCREFQIEGVSNNCAALIEQLVSEKRAVSSIGEISAACARAREKRHPAICFLAPGGTASPDWAPPPPPMWGWETSGGNDGYTRAVIENIAGFVIGHLRDLGECGSIRGERPSIAVTGGASVIDYLLEFISAASGCELLRSDSTQGAARGAALAAMRGAGAIDETRELNMSTDAERIWSVDSEASARYEAWTRMRRITVG